MATCPFCRKAIDPVATRCRHCGGEIHLSSFQPVETTFYSAVVAPALGAALMSFVFWILSPFSGYFVHFALGEATDLGLRDYMIDAEAAIAIALLAMALSALCGWLHYTRDSLLLSLLTFCTPFCVPPALVIAVQLADVAGST